MPPKGRGKLPTTRGRKIVPTTSLRKRLNEEGDDPSYPNYNNPPRVPAKRSKTRSTRVPLRDSSISVSLPRVSVTLEEESSSTSDSQGDSPEDFRGEDACTPETQSSTDFVPYAEDKDLPSTEVQQEENFHNTTVEQQRTATTKEEVLPERSSEQEAGENFPRNPYLLTNFVTHRAKALVLGHATTAMNSRLLLMGIYGTKFFALHSLVVGTAISSMKFRIPDMGKARRRGKFSVKEKAKWDAWKAIDEETEDTSMNQVNEIGYKIATGGWFVSEGESILLAHDDGSCSFYGIANAEENKPEMGIAEETKDTYMDQVNEIWYKIATGGWFVENQFYLLMMMVHAPFTVLQIQRYVNDAIKEGTGVSVFRKESTGEDGKGSTYWYDGDSTIGHRLYKEITKVEFVKMKGKGRLTQPTIGNSCN
ncbi:hypothetical protein GIB67_026892 [Kingdonia uniflora]|uniref:Uncharacterized protein n=1 Tax=Kingdonia uniflora TaxID=39325 RepID=A0A7J7M7V1_9MAGN|nr:hypothetical protein GIB67_026892 [Kingdonia uniflora]